MESLIYTTQKYLQQDWDSVSLLFAAPCRYRTNGYGEHDGMPSDIDQST